MNLQRGFNIFHWHVWPGKKWKSLLFQKLQWRNGCFIHEAAYVPARLRQQAAHGTNWESNFSCRFLLAYNFMCCVTWPWLLAILILSYQLISYWEFLIRIHCVQELRFSQWSWWKIMLSWEMMVYYQCIFGYQHYKEASVSRIEERWCTEMLAHLYWSTLCNIPDVWQLNPMAPNIFYVHNVQFDIYNAKYCICSCAALPDSVLI